jgi:hypothetical protein
MSTKKLIQGLIIALQARKAEVDEQVVLLSRVNYLVQLSVQQIEAAILKEHLGLKVSGNLDAQYTEKVSASPEPVIEARPGVNHIATPEKASFEFPYNVSTDFSFSCASLPFVNPVPFSTTPDVSLEKTVTSSD